MRFRRGSGVSGVDIFEERCLGFQSRIYIVKYWMVRAIDEKNVHERSLSFCHPYSFFNEQRQKRQLKHKAPVTSWHINSITLHSPIFRFCRSCIFSNTFPCLPYPPAEFAHGDASELSSATSKADKGYTWGTFTSFKYLEDHPMTCKWLITMVIVSPLGIGLWDPLQMA